MALKSQSAIEYLLIIALALGLLLPTTYIFFRYATKSNNEIVDSQINQIGKTIVDTAKTVFFSGEGSKIILELKVPENVIDVYILVNRELVFKVLSEAGERESVFFSSTNIPLISDDPNGDCTSGTYCSLSDLAGEGLKKVKVEAIDDGTGRIVVIIMEINE